MLLLDLDYIKLNIHVRFTYKLCAIKLTYMTLTLTSSHVYTEHSPEICD